jgi:RNA polymerase sigma-70 factor (ECF subfamily)
MLQVGEVAEMLPSADADTVPTAWIEAFYRGGPDAMAIMYREHFGTVSAAVLTVVSGADGETVIHEVFFRLLSNEGLRRAYRACAGNFSSWLYTLAKHHAIDYVRHRARETPSGLSPGEEGAASQLSHQIEARVLVRRFREEVLPPEWVSVFDARFVRQMDQRRAAQLLGIPRSTLVYREHRIRSLLRTFLLAGDEA